MQKHFFFTILCLFSINLASAQIKFLEGYIVLLTNDTLKGVIADAALQEPLNEIYFKKYATDRAVQKYLPNSILGFGLVDTNLHFLTHEVALDKKSVPPSPLNTNPFPEYIKTFVFLKQLVTGPISLLYHKDNNQKKHYFVYSPKDEMKKNGINYRKIEDGIVERTAIVDPITFPQIETTTTISLPDFYKSPIPVELLHIFYDKGAGKIGERQLYKAQLDILLKEFVKQPLDTLQFTEGSFKAVIEQYNKGYEIKHHHDFFELKNDLEMTIWSGGSWGIGRMTGFTGISPIVAPYVKDVTYTDFLSLPVGLSLKLKPREFPKYLFVNFDFFYLRHHFKAAKTLSETEKYTTNLSMSYLSFTPSVGFTLNHQLKPYLRIGGHLTLLRNMSSRLLQETQLAGITYQVEKQPFLYIQNFALGLTSAMGIQHGKWIFEARYDYTALKPLDDGLYLKGHDVKLLLGYRFYQQSRSLKEDKDIFEKKMKKNRNF
jgi:hypothetical protein